MNRIPVVTEEARGLRRFVLWMAKRQYGGVVPGVLRVMLYDLKVGRAMDTLYRYLHLRRSSPLTRLQREMLATVVNGKVGGAP
jgi:hypothetical protein